MFRFLIFVITFSSIGYCATAHLPIIETPSSRMGRETGNRISESFCKVLSEKLERNQLIQKFVDIKVKHGVKPYMSQKEIDVAFAKMSADYDMMQSQELQTMLKSWYLRCLLRENNENKLSFCPIAYSKKAPYSGYGKISSRTGYPKTKSVSGHLKRTSKGLTYVNPYARSK